MRARGAQTTDLVILVISATEGVQKQTREVIDIIRHYNLPTIIALNKCDRPAADP